MVLWIVFGLVSITLYFAHSMSFELRAADTRVAAAEADEAVQAAQRYLTCVLSNLNMPGSIPDPQSYLREAVPVGNAHFWLIGRTNSETLTTIPLTCCLVDEAAKCNLNSASASILSNTLSYFTRLTPDTINAIIAWRSTNTTSTTGGAESDTYQRLQPPYLCKNAPFETLEELRLVYGMDIDFLYGEDANMNGILDPNENDGDALPPTDNADGRLDPGLLEYLTIYTHEPLTYSNGTAARIDITATTATTTLQPVLAAILGASRASQIIPRAGGAGGGTTYTSPLQFYMATSTAAGLTTAEFALIEPAIRGSRTTGLVNVNTAGSVVLAGLPGMDITKATQLVQAREAILANPDNQNTISWVPTVLDTATAQQIGPYITGKSYQFSADIAALGHNGRGYRRVRFVFDISTGVPTILYRQDLTRLGWALGKPVRDKWLLGSTKQ
jgi:DNA uptake protein ComE-like DNA-binding protein